MENLKKINAKQLRIYVMEHDKIQGKPSHEAIISKAIELKISGATVFKGVLGYGCHRHIHTTKLVTLSDNLPLLVEIIDTEENIQKIIPFIYENVEAGLFTLVNIEMYGLQKNCPIN